MTSANYGATAGNGLFTLQANAGCVWQAVSQSDWITVNLGNNWSGSGTIGYLVAANTGAARSGTITAGGLTFTVNQASGCTYTLSSNSANVSSNSTTGSFNISSDTGCDITAVSNAPFITITSETNSGNGTISYSITANTTAQNRTGTITVGGQIFTINQSSSCTYSVGLASLSINSTGGNGNITVTTQPDVIGKQSARMLGLR
jgi:hypothetical protein